MYRPVLDMLTNSNILPFPELHADIVLRFKLYFRSLVKHSFRYKYPSRILYPCEMQLNKYTMEWRLLIYASFIVTISFLIVGQCNGNGKFMKSISLSMTWYFSWHSID